MSVLCPECARLGCACFNCLQKVFTPHYTPPFWALPEPNRRYGIIPCRRCAFWDRISGEVLDEDAFGMCRLRAPSVLPAETYDKINNRLRGATYAFWPQSHFSEGCGDGLLREEAAPLPPEHQEPKP